MLKTRAEGSGVWFPSGGEIRSIQPRGAATGYHSTAQQRQQASNSEKIAEKVKENEETAEKQ